MAATLTEKLTARDIMQKHVVVLGPNDSLQEAMNLMTEHHVSGIPVLGRKDRCIGVISASDILNYQQEQSEYASSHGDDSASYFDPDSQRWENVHLKTSTEDLPEVPISEVMTRDLVSVSPSSSINDVANKMVNEEIHRILVLDEKQCLHGIISTVDFVRLFAD